MFESSPAARLPVTILTGFLGAGKTTILNRLIQRTDFARTLVVINEFGAVGIDHSLVVPSREETVVEMASGCLCCTIRGDLVRTLRDAPRRFARDGVCWFDRVLIETTGLADPAPILHSFLADQTLGDLYRLDGVVVAVDAVAGQDTLDRQPEAEKQVAVADHLLLTKTDLADPEAIAMLLRRLRILNPAATPIVVNHGDVDPSGLFEGGLYDPSSKSEDVRRWLKAEAYADEHAHHGDHDQGAHDHHHDVNRHGDAIRSVCLTIDEPIADVALERWLEVLMMVKGPDMLRVKGLVNVLGHDRPIVLHAVQHMIHEPVQLDRWPDDDHRTRIVFITRGVEPIALRDMLNMIVEGVRQFDLNGADDLGLFTADPPSNDAGVPLLGMRPS